MTLTIVQTIYAKVTITVYFVRPNIFLLESVLLEVFG